MCPFDDDDAVSLKPKAITLWHEHQSLLGSHSKVQAERDALAARVKELEAQVARKNKAIFGPTSERSKDKDNSTTSNEGAVAPTPSEESKPKQTGHGRRDQIKLRSETTEHTLSGKDLLCGSCGGTLTPFGGQEEPSREIDVERREFVQRTHKRQKYVCRCGACILTAPGPLKLKEGNLYSIGFGVHVATDSCTAPISSLLRPRSTSAVGKSKRCWGTINTNP